MASMNHASVSRSRKIQYTAPSLSATSHSSRFHFLLAWGPAPTPDALAALSWLVGPHPHSRSLASSRSLEPRAPCSRVSRTGRRSGLLPAPPATLASRGPQALHHSPDVRHGPAQV